MTMTGTTSTTMTKRMHTQTTNNLLPAFIFLVLSLLFCFGFLLLLIVYLDYSMGAVLVDPSQYVVADNYGDGSETTPMVQHEEQPFRIEGTIISDDGPSSQKKKKKKKKKGEKSFYQLGYYKELFDFDTDVILHRIWNASNPANYVDFWEDTKDQPDFYVPLWGATTLWFLLVVCGDFGASFVNEHCTVDTYYFDKVGWGAFAVYGYLFILPICWFVCFKFWLDIPLGLFGHICLYGYSLLPYIPTMVCLCSLSLSILYFV